MCITPHFAGDLVLIQITCHSKNAMEAEIDPSLIVDEKAQYSLYLAFKLCLYCSSSMGYCHGVVMI